MKEDRTAIWLATAWSQAQLNGRDIRNALQTAITLAAAECEEDPDFDPTKMAIIVEQKLQSPSDG
ncbi:uncharacterized protein HMPREF1541_10036 [Cyphellophora europaea CBS 101466]|uniref:AAA+ ATPase lid domain-containing protein n=1 Tax=Cyphellophora europaea (strain CBS 101466) TaxID=1220924 RepID=W2SB59_CYPE1|nr:uncharacterized protein HMPREF1541_10036 [Cyphellophora europaea CBS 101466]ETN45159.1 hypothetical protein HMPREF1541_10036 [Cyphellophora europaea CBS 101466]